MAKEHVKLVDLIDVDTLQRVQDAFSAAAGVAAIITDENGEPVTKGSNFTQFCMEHTRCSKLGKKRCEECDRYGAVLTMQNGKARVYSCHAGLKDFAAPIMANGKMVGSFIGGQVLTEPADEDRIREVARELGIDEDEYVEAVRKVEIVDEVFLDKITDFLQSFTNILSDMAVKEHSLNIANIELEKAAQMKADFLANMSHEIRTPMNAVIGMAEMALREELPPNARDYVNQIMASGKTLLTIINDILDFSKIESGKMDIICDNYEPFLAINEILSVVMTRIGAKPLALTVDIPLNMPGILYGDPTRIKQVITNLANNAVKFTAKGEVHIHISTEKLSSDEILVMVDVKDTGLGIKQDKLNMLFQSFQQLDSKRNRNIEGTGLGLAISKQLVNLMGGQIYVDSVYEKGSTFSFSLPQKVIDSKPYLEGVKEPTEVRYMIDNEYVKKQLIRDLIKIDVPNSEIKREEEIYDWRPQGKGFIVVEHILFDEYMEDYVRANQDISCIVLVDFHTTIQYPSENIKVVKKPLVSYNLLSLITTGKGLDANDQGFKDFNFVAPEAQVLIVDDNQVNLTVACGLLEPLKMKLDTAVSGADAVNKISAKHYDLIFMDHMMPELDGVETTHIIRRFHPEYDNVPIIALTANAVGGVKAMFISEGMDDLVAKPINMKEVTDVVRKWLPAEKIIKLDDPSKEADESDKDVIIDAEAEERKAIIMGLADMGLDVNSAIQMLGSEKIYVDVVKDYLSAIERKAKEIKKYEVEENIEMYTIEVHALKSASRQIGAIALGKYSEKMETAGKLGKLDVIHAGTDSLIEQYNSIKFMLQGVFGVEEILNKDLIPHDMLLMFLLNIEGAIENTDIDIMDAIIEQMRIYRYEDNQVQLFEDLQIAVEDIDMESCADILLRWKQILQ